MFDTIIKPQAADFTLARDEVASLNAVVSYCFDDERRHWQELGRPREHIFRHVRVVKDTLARLAQPCVDFPISSGDASPTDFVDYAKAIALRVSDEWDGGGDFPECAQVLRGVLERLLSNNPDECQKLIGIGIIEADYFDAL
jgi:hypothetical protein